MNVLKSSPSLEGAISTELAIFRKHKDQLRNPPPIPSHRADSRTIERPSNTYGKLIRYSEPVSNLLEYRPNREFNQSIQNKREYYDSIESMHRTRDYSGYKVNRAFQMRSNGI